jgi:hypothetical protein
MRVRHRKRGLEGGGVDPEFIIPCGKQTERKGKKSTRANIRDGIALHYWSCAQIARHSTPDLEGTLQVNRVDNNALCSLI